jgi:hypothetical protein
MSLKEKPGAVAAAAGPVKELSNEGVDPTIAASFCKNKPCPECLDEALDALCVGLPDYAERNVRDAFAKRPDYFRFDRKANRLRIKTRVGGRCAPEWKALWNAVARCSDPIHHPTYKDRRVAEVFRHGDGVRSGFERWFAELSLKPSLDLDVDRIDNGGNYSVGNLRWASRAANLRNRPNPKLNERQVAEIKAIGDRLPKRLIGERYGVTQRMISFILLGPCHADIPAAKYRPAWAARVIAERRATRQAAVQKRRAA